MHIKGEGNVQLKKFKNTSRKLAWHYVIILLCLTQEKLNSLPKTVHSMYHEQLPAQSPAGAPRGITQHTVFPLAPTCHYPESITFHHEFLQAEARLWFTSSPPRLCNGEATTCCLFIVVVNVISKMNWWMWWRSIFVSWIVGWSIGGREKLLQNLVIIYLKINAISQN